MKLTRSALRLLIGATVLACGVPLLGSCNIAAPVFFAVHGPAKVEPKHVLDPAATTVVFIDDPASKVGRRRLRGEIGNAASGVLLNRGLVADMVNANAALLAATKERYGEPMSITEIGRAVEADVVVYALMTKFTLSSDNQAYSPSCTMMVKVMDVTTGERVWPPDPQGFALILRPRTRTGPAPSTPGDIARAEQDLAARAGLAIAQLFYKHEIQTSVAR